MGIKFNQISENRVEIIIPSNTPMEIVQELTKSLVSKGLVEDLSKSTLSVRNFYRSNSKIDSVADKLIKSLEDMAGLSKAKKLPWWASNQAEVDKHTANLKQLDAKIKPKPQNVSAEPTEPNTSAKPSSDRDWGWTAGGTGRPYGTIKDTSNAEKSEKQNKSIKDKKKNLSADEVAADQLIKYMQDRGMLNNSTQPTDEQMFGHLAVSDEVAKQADNKWNNTFNNWLTEASKPISDRFASEQDEINYWNSIKIGDRDDGQSGY